MIIAFDISQAAFGTGVGVYIINLITAWAKLNLKDVSFKFFGFSRGQFDKLTAIQTKFAHVPYFHFYIFPYPERVRVLSLKLRLDPSVLIGRYDLLHTPDWLGYYSHKPTVATVHDLAIHRFPYIFHTTIVKQQKKYLEWLSQKAAAVVCVSKTTQKDLRTYYPQTKNKAAVIYEANPFAYTKPADWSAARQKYGLEKQKKFFLSIATLEPRKNLTRLIKAFNQANLPGFDLLIAGKVGWGDVQLPPNPRLKLLGYIPSSDLVSLLKHSQGLVYPSLWEGFGLPIAAAADFQVPVLTSNLGSMAEIAPPSAVLINPLDVNDIAWGLKKLTRIKPEPNHRFSWLTTAQRTLDLYHNILKL
ncbi:MAG: glycosyltransferase family 4 protein [bacterium]|nr:glycosyltransferase family 4 protein [bacterium]